MFYHGKYKELSAESSKQATTSDNSLTPELNQDKSKTRVKFNGIKNFIHT